MLHCLFVCGFFCVFLLSFFSCSQWSCWDIYSSENCLRLKVSDCPLDDYAGKFQIFGKVPSNSTYFQIFLILLFFLFCSLLSHVWSIIYVANKKTEQISVVWCGKCSMRYVYWGGLSYQKLKITPQKNGTFLPPEFACTWEDVWCCRIGKRKS